VICGPEIPIFLANFRCDPALPTASHIRRAPSEKRSPSRFCAPLLMLGTVLHLDSAVNENHLIGMTLAATIWHHWEMSIGDRLRIAREEAGLGVRELARECGVSNAQISRLEAGGRTPRPDTLLLLADHLGVRVEWLLAGRGAMRPDSTPTELGRAVEYLRGELPDDYLDDALQSAAYQGPRYTRDQIVMMLRARHALLQDGDLPDASAELAGQIDNVRRLPRKLPPDR